MTAECFLYEVLSDSAGIIQVHPAERNVNQQLK